MTRDALKNTPKANLLLGPSPIHPLPRLSEHLGGKVNLWAKREDLNSGLAYGGNKTRKLEYLAQDAINQGCDTLVSIGGVQSNHTRQVAAVAAKLGLKAVLVQEHWVDWDEPHYETTGNILLSRIMGAEVRLDPAGFDIGFRPSWEKAIEDIEALHFLSWELGLKAVAIYRDNCKVGQPLSTAKKDDDTADDTASVAASGVVEVLPAANGARR